jgi:chromosome segregation ATPase
MLSEVLKDMQNQQSKPKDGKPGKKTCKKPGSKPGGQKSGKPSMSTLRQMQEQLNKQMQAMKQGKGEGMSKRGQQVSKELAQMAAKQEAIRRELQKLNDLKNKGNGSMKNELNELQKQMDKTETDLVNKKISDETIKRQQEILTRMLESEKAEKQQDMDEKRESKSANQKAGASPPSLEKYQKIKEREIELLRTVPPGLNSYYRQKVKDYFEQVK